MESFLPSQPSQLSLFETWKAALLWMGEKETKGSSFLRSIRHHSRAGLAADVRTAREAFLML